MTASQGAVAASLLFLGSAVLAGLTLLERGVAYRTFGLVEGIFALLLTYVLVRRGAWSRAGGWIGWMPLVYGTLANAQALELLMPPPGMIEWGVVGALSVAAWGALGSGGRHRVIVSLASLALLLAVLRFSVIPVLWANVGPAAGTALGLGDVAESARRVLADYQPVRPVTQLVGFLALCLWALATRILWPPLPAADSEPTVSGNGGEDD